MNKKVNRRTGGENRLKITGAWLARFGIAAPKVGLLSIGEEPTKGSPLVKETHKLLADPAWSGDTAADPAASPGHSD